MLSILSAMANPAKPELTDDEGGPDTSDTTAADTTAVDTTGTDTDAVDATATETDVVDEETGASHDDAMSTAAANDAPTSGAGTSSDAAPSTGSTRTSPASGSGSAAKPSSAASAPKKVLPPKAKAKAKVAPGNSQITPSRHTPAQPTSGRRAPSPRWVPVLMFALWGIGLLLIVLNYMGVLPGTEDAGNGWYLVAGLVSILGGIMVATQYH